VAGDISAIGNASAPDLGHNRFDEIVAWGEHHLEFLRRFAPFHFGIPGERWLHTLVNRVDPIFLLALKDNQSTLETEAEDYFCTAPADQLAAKTAVEKGHGRTDVLSTRGFTSHRRLS
jgi:hypothetical protein